MADKWEELIGLEENPQMNLAEECLADLDRSYPSLLEELEDSQVSLEEERLNDLEWSFSFLEKLEDPLQEDGDPLINDEEERLVDQEMSCPSFLDELEEEEAGRTQL